MPVELRPFVPEHWEGVLQLHRTVFPEYHEGPVFWRPGQQIDEPAQAAARHVVMENGRGRVVGYGAIRETAPSRYRVNLLVHPDFRGRGAGAALLARLYEEATARGAVALNARARADQDAGLRFLRKAGFEEVHRMCGMLLHLAGLDLSPFYPITERLRAEGVAFGTLAEEQRRGAGWLERLHEVYTSARPGWPNPDPTWSESAMPPEHFARLADSSVKDPQRLWLAEAGGRLVGFCGDFGTGVRPDFRGRGIATALKVLYVEHARRRGVQVVHSSSANPALLAINRRLGYRPWYTEVRFVKPLVGT
jgi:GNAT superfamily N-acetyltransferase